LIGSHSTAGDQAGAMIIAGRCMARARWRGPVSSVMAMSARAMMAASSRRLARPAMLAVAKERGARRASIAGDSEGAPAKRICML